MNDVRVNEVQSNEVRSNDERMKSFSLEVRSLSSRRMQGRNLSRQAVACRDVVSRLRLRSREHNFERDVCLAWPRIAGRVARLDGIGASTEFAQRSAAATCVEHAPALSCRLPWVANAFQRH